jgi:hypothetical protein
MGFITIPVLTKVVDIKLMDARHGSSASIVNRKTAAVAVLILEPFVEEDCSNERPKLARIWDIIRRKSTFDVCGGSTTSNKRFANLY